METDYCGHQSILTGRCSRYSGSTNIFALTLIFNPRRAVVMNRTHVECQSQSPVGSKARTGTDGLTESQTRPITLPSLLTQTVKSLHFYTRSSNVKQMLQFNCLWQGSAVIFNASGVRDCHFQHENFLLADKSTEAGKSKKPTTMCG